MSVSRRLDFTALQWADIAFWLVAIALLFWGLGSTGLWNSEDRWMEIAREMQLSGNYLRPTINAVVYFDKPLGGYWLVLLSSFITGGINEWSLRLPSALSGLLTLWATRALGRRLWSDQIGRLAGWLLLTSYGFLMWGRSGEADMENLAASILAVSWYWQTRAKPNFFSYFIFYLIIFVGAQAKGLTAAVVPILAVACDIFRGGRWRSHVSFAHMLALAAGSAFYILPFMLAERPAAGGAGDAGLLLVFRENVVRYFSPFDHDDPFYMYFLWLQVLWFPWLPLLWGGIANIFIAPRAHTENTRWLIATFSAIFLFFLLSGSRRIYYILPLLPYCALLIALFLRGEELQPWRRYLLRAQAGFSAFIIALLLALPTLLPTLAQRRGIALPADFSVRSAALIGVLALLCWLLAARACKRFGIENKAVALIGVAAIVLGGVFVELRAAQDRYRTEWPFARALKPIAAPLPAAQIAAFRDRVAGGLLYYAELPPGFAVFVDAEALLQFAQTPPYPKLILANSGDLAALPPALTRLPPLLIETQQPWERKNATKMRAWLLERAPE